MRAHGLTLALSLQAGRAPSSKPKGRESSAGADDSADHRREFVKARREVLEYGASTFEGRDKRIWEGKTLASLGAIVKESHKMPRKMKMGVQSKQRHLEKRRAEKERESGVIHGKSARAMTVHGARVSKAEKMVHRKKSERKLGGVRSLDDDRWSGGVLHVKKHKR